MKNSAVIFLLLTLSLTVSSQKPKTAKAAKSTAQTSLAATEKAGDETAEFERAVSTANAAERAEALRRFALNYPQSEKKTEAQELLVVARVAAADEKLRAGDAPGGTQMFRLAVKDAPVPFSDKLFGEIILQIPTNLFWRGEQKAALEIAQTIEAKTADNAKQTLGLASFYLGIENAAEAERLARKAIALDANLPAAHQTLGLAHRINFQLDEAADAYAKALALDPASNVSKRSLAEMKRAAGKSDEAAALYREVLTNDATDVAAQTGLILALFDGGKQGEAETELSKSLSANANNLPLLVGAAYWYAASGDGARAVELASKAVEIEPRYTWAHIALARGLTAQKRPLEAERTLIAARQYGNFPTLDYEIASARFRAGFFREAAEMMRQNFTVKNETVATRLGNRVARESDNFIDLLAAERRASIFQPAAADDRETAEQLKSLLIFADALDAASTNETEIARAADRFVAGDDELSVHRRIYAAARLLQTGKSLPKSYEIAQSALGKTDAGLNAPNAAAAVLADELYESRTLAASRNQSIVVPDVPRQTLSAILRGRVEEIAGWTLYQQNDAAQAIVRLRRAVSVLPADSAWWRSSMWRLGAALQTEGKEKEALDVYLRSHPKEALDSARYGIIETLYQKVNGSLDGLDARLGSKSAAPAIVSAAQIKATPATTETAAQSQVKNEAAAEPRTQPLAAVRTPKIPDNVPLMAAPKVETETATAKPIETSPVETFVQKPIETPKEPEAPKQNDVADEKKAAEEIKADEEIKETTAKAETTTNAETPKEIPASGAKNFNQTRNPSVGSGRKTAPANAESKPAPENVAQRSTDAEQNVNESAQPIEKPPVVAEVAAPESKTENSSSNDAPADTVTKPSEATPENLTEKSPEKTEPAKVDSNSTAAKSLFDPIVITVPQRETAKPETSTRAETKPENAPTNEKTEETKPIAIVEEKPPVTPTPETKTADLATSRPRVIVTDNFSPEKIEPCRVYVNQEDISLLNGGGVLGVLVGLGSKGDIKQLVAASSSPENVEVSFEPEIVAPENQAFFVIKSVSTKTGVFTVTFEAPCGKKELSVKVR